MANVINLVGLKFGRLLVNSKNEIKGNRRQVRWNCECDCGNNHIVTGESLRNGKSKSCGCLLKEARHVKNKNSDREKAMLLLVYSPLKKRHRQKFNNENYIDFETFKNLSTSNCFYCNSEPLNTQPDVRYETRKDKKEKLIITDFVLKYNGIDRVNSSLGYEFENVVSCCKNCNSAKMQLSTGEFKKHIIKIYEHFILRQSNGEN
jgi:hypothetical protein